MSAAGERTSAAATAGRSALLDPALVDRVRRRLADDGASPSSPGRVAAAFRTESGAPVGDAGLLAALSQLRSEFVGAGPLEPLLRDPATTDVLVNAPHEVWVDQGEGLRRTSVRFPDDDAVRRLAQRLAAAAGRRLDAAQPWVDARLPDGTRLHAVLPPVAASGTLLSLRVPRPRAYRLEQLVAASSISPAGARVLTAIVRARLAFLISGGTGSGKTTLLATLLGLVDPGERIVVVEDARELRLDHPHVVALEARLPNIEGAGGVTMRDLVRQALRMRPDRIVVGEVRGAEVAELLTALNTGHEGGAGTVHANSTNDVPARLEALGALAGLDRHALHSQLAAAVQCVVHLSRRGGRRLVSEVSVLSRLEGAVAPLPAWRLDAGPIPGAPLLRSLLAARSADPGCLP